MGGVRNDKARDATDGYDGGWVAHPGLVDLAMAEFKKVLGDKPNQIDKQRGRGSAPSSCWTSSRKRRSPKPACATTSTSASTTWAPGWPATAACRSTT
jgi:malate synthase